MLKVNIYNEHPANIDKLACRRFARFLWQNEGGTDSEVNIIFVDLDFIKKINHRFLNKNAATDVIAFPLEGDPYSGAFSGEVYICVDQVCENAKLFETSEVEELKRVVAHGLLHLLGYGDKTREDAQQMRGREDYYLKKRKEITIGI